MNLFSTFNDVLSPDILSRIAVYMDEPTEKTHKAVDGLVFTIIGGLMKRTTTEIGVNQLFNHIKKGHFDGSIIDSLASVLRDPAHTNTLISQGNDVISHLLPAMKSSIGSMISSYAGIRNSSAIALLGLTSTLVLDVLGKQVKERKLDADGLASSLFAERENFVNTVPEEFMPRLVEKVGLQQIVAGLAGPARRQTAETPVRQTANTSSPTPRSTATATRPAISYEPADDSDNEGGSLAKWGIGALLAIAVAAVGYYVYQNTQKHANGQEQVSEVITGDTVQADTVARSLAVPKDTTLRAVAPATKPASVSMTATAPAPVTAVAGTSNLEQVLTPYLSNPALPKGKVFPLAGVAFQPGSMSLTPSSQATIAQLTTLLKSRPSLQIQLVGYANDAAPGTTNKSLSFKRVNLIKQQLMASGIDFVRIDAIGRGTGVSRKDTSGIPKPTLRKIDMKVIVK